MVAPRQIHVVSSLELGALHQSRGLVIEMKSAPNFVKPVWKSSEMNVSVMNRIVSKDELPTLPNEKTIVFCIREIFS